MSGLDRGRGRRLRRRTVSSYHPRLRAHLQLVEGELVDGLLQRELTLEGTAAALAARLDGATDWPTLQAALVADGHDADEVDAALRSFYRLHLVEGAGDDAMARLEHMIRSDEPVSTTVLAGARFGCQGSGGCCQGYSFGPLADDDVAMLDRLDLAAAFPALAPPYLEDREDAPYLRTVDGRCVFLAGDRRCGLHAAFGAEAKPGFCRLYPIEGFATVDGVRVVDRGTCATFGVSARSGLPIVDDLDRLRPLLGRFVLHHPMALVDGEGWDYGLFLRFTAAADDLVTQRRGTATETLHALGRCLDALATVVATCPLEPGQPDAYVDSVLAIAPESWYRTARPEASARGVDAVVELLGQLAAEVTVAVEEGRARASTERCRAFVALVADTIVDLAEGAPEPARCEPDVDDALRSSLQQQLFGRRVLVDGHAGAGLVRLGLIQLLALSAARTDAGDRPLAARDLSRGHMLAVRAFETSVLDEVLGEHDPAWRLLLDGLAHITRLRPA